MAVKGLQLMVDKLSRNKELSLIWRQDWAVVHTLYWSAVIVSKIFGVDVKNVLTMNK